MRRDRQICTEIAVFALNLSDIIFLRTAPHSRLRYTFSGKEERAGFKKMSGLEQFAE